ncbi:hypothetical protein [Companilactobacillus mishanensis]|uniref:Surface layer protein A domain-containing protein n=1 Tax=Companilactobacillus mishanensis TaxID=2486008 RepID=A0ABW9P7V1_9LACO|nr:hypothetical protein [Companilactobacillus mishanensis]MQS45237.1 hypothetical protein [Companilactobacillus mishanensis]
MKKNIKYAGVVAATLLAVAPVATSATTVNAATTNTATTAAATKLPDWLTKGWDELKEQADKIIPGVKDLLNKIMNQVVNKPEEGTKEATATDIVNKISNQTYNNDSEIPTFDFLKADNNKEFSASDFSDLMTQLKLVNDTDAATIKKTDNITYKISGGDDNDFNVLVDNMVKNGNGESVSVTFTSYDTSKSKTTAINTKQVTFTNNKTVTTAANGLNVQFTNPIAIGLNTKVVNQKLTDSVTATVTNESGTNVAYTSAYVDPNLYTSEDAANAGGKSGIANTGTTFTQDGAKYYQRVTLNFDPEVVNIGSIYNSMQHARGSELNINGNKALQYQVNQKDGLATGATTNSITYVRELAVGTQPNDNDNDNNTDTDTDTTPDETWSMTPNSGIVTVNGSLAPLHNDDNDVTTRSLGANSAWQTDQYRVNSKTGEKQYRVSSHEWVSSDYVTFGGTTSNGSGLSNVSDLTGHHTISLAGPDGFVYALFGINGGRSNRGLAGNSAWYTDKSATDSEGNTFYRVSTDEWVQAGSGVTFN